MLKQTVEYIDFDEQRAVETVYFNITKTELTSHLHLKEELEKMLEMFQGPKRELGTNEITQILDLVKLFMRLSYGVRSEDGKRFIKSPQLWTEFTQTSVYDTFLFSLFENADNAFNFMLGVMPADLREQATAEAKKMELQMSTAQAMTHPAPVDIQSPPPAGYQPNQGAPVQQTQPTPEQIAAAMQAQQAQTQTQTQDHSWTNPSFPQG